MSEVTERLGRLEVKVDEFGDRLVTVEIKLNNVENRLDKIETAFTTHFDRLTTKIEKIDTGLDDIKLGLGKQDVTLTWLKKVLIIAFVAAIGGTGSAKLLDLLQDATPPAMAQPSQPTPAP